MITLLLLWKISSTLACPAVERLNTTNERWDADDESIVTTATKTCARRYAPRSPCLISVTKKEDQHYEAICGAMREVK